MKNVEQFKEVQDELVKFNILRRVGNGWEFLYTGTYDKCDNELNENCDSDHPDYEIVKNSIKDQWEDEVAGIGYVHFTNDPNAYNLFTYRLLPAKPLK